MPSSRRVCVCGGSIPSGRRGPSGLGFQGGAAYTAQGTLRFTRSAGQISNLSLASWGASPFTPFTSRVEGAGWGRLYGPRNLKVHPECWANF